MTAHLSKGIIFENVSNGNVDMRTEGLEAFTRQAESANNILDKGNRQLSLGFLTSQR